MPALLSPTVIGRAPEITRLKAYLSEAREARGRVVFLTGEAGIGKSRLAAEFANLARTEGVRVLTGRAGVGAAATPFRPFVEAFHSALEPPDLRHPALEHYRALLNRLLGFEVAGVAVRESPNLAAMEALLRLLRVTSSSRPLLLVIEDLQAADRETLGTIEYVSDKLGADHILFVATERSDAGGLSDDLVTSLVARRTAEWIELHPLQRAEVEAFACAALREESISPPLLDAVWRRTAGNPFLIEEMLGSYVEAGGIDPESEYSLSGFIADRIPSTYREVVRERLKRLNERSLAVTFAAAVVGRSFDARLLPAITGLADDKVKEGLKEAIRGHLLAALGDHFAWAYGFRHALARESVVAELLPDERADLAGRAARAIELIYPELPGDWCEHAANLYEEGGFRMDAVRLLQESARRALTRSALQTAESALLRARGLVKSDWMMWMAIDDLLLDVYSRSGKTEGLAESGTRLIAALDQRYGTHNLARRIAEIHLKIARGMLAGADQESTERHLVAATEVMQHDHDASLAPEILSLSARAALAGGRSAEGERQARDAVAASLRKPADSRCDSLDALAAASLALGELKEARDSWREVLELAEKPKLALWKVRALLGIGTIDVLETGDTSRLASARALALQIGALGPYALIELQYAWAHLGRPDLVPARSHLERCWELIRLHDLGIAHEAMAAQCMLLALHRDGKELRRFGDRQGPEPALQSSRLANGDAVLAVVEGKDVVAREYLEEAARLTIPNPTDWWVGLRHLLAAATSGEDVPSSYQELSHRGRLPPMGRAYENYARAIIAGKRGDGMSARAAASEGDLCMPPGWRRHHARRVVADAALESGWGDPVKWAGEAIEFFDHVNLPGLVTSCRATLRKAGAPVRRRGRGEAVVPEELQALGVTSREMDVLKLVADRLSNRDIAEHLFISNRTVETHVSNLQRKTQTHGRKELIEFARRGLPKKTRP